MSSSQEQSQGPVVRDLRRVDPVTGRVRDPDQVAQADPRSGRHTASSPGGSAGSSPRTSKAGGPGAAADAGSAAAGGPDTGNAAAAAAAAGGPPEGGPSRGGAAGADKAAGAGEAAAKLAERTADLQRLQAEYANYRKRVERDRLAVREQALANVLTELLPVLDDIGRAREHGELAGGFKSVAESLEATVAKLGLSRYGEEGDPFDPTLHEALMHSYSEDVTEFTCVRILQPGYQVGDRILRPARVAVAEPGGPDSAGEPAAEDGGPGEPAADSADSAERAGGGSAGPAADAGAAGDAGGSAGPGEARAADDAPSSGAG